MTTFVKEFIEEFIDTIEAEDWELIIDYWYNYVDQSGIVVETFDEHLDEFADIIFNIGVSFRKETEQLRKDYLKEKLEESFAEEAKFLADFPTYDTITKNEVLYRIATTLLIPSEEVDKMLDDIAISNGFIIEKDCYRKGK